VPCGMLDLRNYDVTAQCGTDFNGSTRSEAAYLER
jgi:hypothetical protein